MIVATLNVRGVGGISKFLALKRFLELTKPDVLLVQETMVCVAKAREIFCQVTSKLVFLWGGFFRTLWWDVNCLESKKR
jgi:hypothetical protein